MPVITVTVGGSDITEDVLFADASFEAQLNAVPGTFHITVKDSAQVLSFTTGTEISVELDGVLIYGGYVLQIAQKHAFPVVDTTSIPSVLDRQWVLTGVDYNILFDKRFLRKTDDYLTQIIEADMPMSAQVAQVMDNYIDAGGFSSSGVQDLGGGNRPFVFEQGQKWREMMNYASALDMAYYYFSPDKVLQYRSVESQVASWGFSDKPNNNPIGTGFPTRGFREMEYTEDISQMVNDALVWGGGPFTDSPTGGTVFSRYPVAPANTETLDIGGYTYTLTASDEQYALDQQTLHGRWQLGENKIGQAHFTTQNEVIIEAHHVVVGGTGSVIGESGRGLTNPGRQIRLTWFDKEVPVVAGVPQYLLPGDIVTFYLYTMHPPNVGALVFTLPLRQIRVTFPTLSYVQGNPYVKFEGFFGLNPDDPYWLWAFLRNYQPVQFTLANSTVTDVYVTDSSTYAPQGAIGSFHLTPNPDGVTTVFSVPFPYVGGSTKVYINGLLQTSGSVYTESSPIDGEITFVSAPVSGDYLWMETICSGA